MKKIKYEDYKEKLFQSILSKDYENHFLDIVQKLSHEGYSKTAIYNLFLEFHKEIQTDSRTKNSELVYDNLSDFMDGFTSWAKGKEILPNETIDDEL